MKKFFYNIHFILVTLLVFTLAWHVLSWIIQSYFLPQPYAVLKTLVKLLMTKEFLTHIVISLKRTLMGFLLALVLAMIISYICGLSRFNRYIRSLIELLRPIPPLAWIPLAIVWFGIGDSSAIFIIIVAAFFHIFSSLYFGIKSRPKEHEKLKQSYNLNIVQYIRHMLFPHSLPNLFSGAKIGIGFSWMVVIAAEIIAAKQGLGYFIEISRVLLNMEQVIATMIVIGLIGYMITSAVTWLEKRVIFWRESEDA